MSKDYDESVLKHIKQVELMVLKDFALICEQNNLDYFLICGSLIGAVRHKGFIPWDDDLDVIMHRKDYEKLLKIMENEKYNDKYTILDSRYIDDYFFLFGRFSLKNTRLEETWSNQINFNLGIHLDIFILDNIPENKIKQFFYRKQCFILDKLLTISTIKLDKHYPAHIRLISNTTHKILNLLNLTPKYFQKKAQKTFRKYENINSPYISNLVSKGQLVFKREYFEISKKVPFENFKANIPSQADTILTLQFGDYMSLPPEDKRTSHTFQDIDFGDY